MSRTRSVYAALTMAAFLAVSAREATAGGPLLSTAAATQLDAGLRSLYALDYARSRAAFHRLIELEPDNPFGYLFEAGGIWWESSQEFDLFKDTPALQAVFEQDVDNAQRMAAAYIDSPDAQTRADGYFVSGMVLGTLGQWRLMKHHWLDAYFIGKKAVKNLKKCVRLDPMYDDAQLGLGVFDYQTAHLSGIAKLGILLGLHGNEKRGLAEIQTAIDRSRVSRRQAAGFLLSIELLDRHDDTRALELTQQMRRDFPDSPYYLFLELLLRYRLGDPAASFALSKELFGRIASDPVAFQPKWLTLACGLSGHNCLKKDSVEPALAWLDEALRDDAASAPSGLTALLRLIRGQLRDVLGRRAQARDDYAAVAALPEFDFSRRRAAACTAASCDRGEVLRFLRVLAHGSSPEATP